MHCIALQWPTPSSLKNSPHRGLFGPYCPHSLQTGSAMAVSLTLPSPPLLPQLPQYLPHGPIPCVLKNYTVARHCGPGG